MTSAFKAFAFAAIFAAGALAACGQGNEQTPPPAAPTVQALPWESYASDAAITTHEDGSVTIAASPTLHGYQAGLAIPVQGATTLELSFDITLTGGPGFIGVLSGDETRWLGNFELAPDQRNTRTVSVPIEGNAVLIVIQTAQGQRPGTAFAIHNVTYQAQ